VPDAITRALLQGDVPAIRRLAGDNSARDDSARR
jgi:hypothetical protein